ncbi:MAG: preprotein translocase subunit SecY [Erysipelotrichaceae bacterium]
MLNKLKDLFKNKDIRNRILFTLAMMLIYRLGAAIPVPKVDTNVLMASLNDNSLLSMMNMLGGGALERFSIFAMGVGPYITASIVIQLLAMDVIPSLTEMAKSGATGRQQMDKITRYLGVILAFVQAGTMTYAFDVSYGILSTSNIATYLYIATVLTAGTMFLMWLGDRITTKGVGNGVSMIIFAGILSNIPWNFLQVFNTLVDTSDSSTTFNGMLGFIGYCLMFLFIILLVIFMNNAVRKIPIQYTSSSLAKGRKDINYLPLKINSASVIPVIFASAIMTAPITILSFFPQTEFSKTLSSVLSFSSISGLAIYLALIVMFTYFYTGLQVDPEKIAENLGKNGTYIPGIRPGKETKEYIHKVLYRITTLGAMFLAFIALLPYVIPMITKLPASFGLGGTGIIIVVGVASETMKDLMGRLTQKSYKGFSRN